MEILRNNDQCENSPNDSKKDDNNFMKIMKNNDKSWTTMQHLEKVTKYHEHEGTTLQNDENLGQTS